MTQQSTNPKDRIGRNKPSPTDVPSALILAVAEVMKLGKKKYGPFNWRTEKVSLKVYLDAACRHILQCFDGEDFDDESQQSHVAHAAACMGIILDALATDNLIDDRPTKGPASALIKKHTITTPAAVTPPPVVVPQYPRYFSFTHSIFVIFTETLGRRFIRSQEKWVDNNWTLEEVLGYWDEIPVEISLGHACAVYGFPEIPRWPKEIRSLLSCGFADITQPHASSPLNEDTP